MALTKVAFGYAACSFLSVGSGPQRCPLCSAIVQDGVRHNCSCEMKPLDVAPDTSLSSMQQEIVDLIVAGMPNPRIAKHLHVTPDTVKYNVQKILEITGLKDRIAIARKYALEQRQSEQRQSERVPLRKPLTPRQQQVCALAVQGLSNKTIALRLNIVEQVVKTHMTKVFQYHGVRDRDALMQKHRLEQEAKKGKKR